VGLGLRLYYINEKVPLGVFLSKKPKPEPELDHQSRPEPDPPLLNIRKSISPSTRLQVPGHCFSSNLSGSYSKGVKNIRRKPPNEGEPKPLEKFFSFLRIRVARFFFVRDTQTGKNVPSQHKMYQMVLKFRKCP
jgi:hypothetical protein